MRPHLGARHGKHLKSGLLWIAFRSAVCCRDIFPRCFACIFVAAFSSASFDGEANGPLWPAFSVAGAPAVTFFFDEKLIPNGMMVKL